MTKYRYILGRSLIHLGLKILPKGRVQNELYQLIDIWATKVHKEVEKVLS